VEPPPDLSLKNLEHNINVSLKFPIPEFNIKTCLSAVSIRIHSFHGYEYDSVKGNLYTQEGSGGYEANAVLRRQKGIFDLVLRVYGKLEGREDSYWFLFFYDSNNKTVSIGGCSIDRQAIPFFIINEVLNIISGNKAFSDFVKKYPRTSSNYAWYSDGDSDFDPLISSLLDAGWGPLDSNVVEARIFAAGGWAEVVPNLDFFVSISEHRILN
jgi:hypothetical protein